MSDPAWPPASLPEGLRSVRRTGDGRRGCSPVYPVRKVRAADSHDACPIAVQTDGYRPGLAAQRAGGAHWPQHRGRWPPRAGTNTANPRPEAAKPGARTSGASVPAGGDRRSTGRKQQDRNAALLSAAGSSCRPGQRPQGVPKAVADRAIWSTLRRETPKRVPRPTLAPAIAVTGLLLGSMLFWQDPVRHPQPDAQESTVASVTDARGSPTPLRGQAVCASVSTPPCGTDRR